MARIVITIEDKPGNKVSITADPSMEQMFSMDRSGHDLTSAHGYAFRMLNEARRVSKEMNPTKILIPRVRN